MFAQELDCSQFNQRRLLLLDNFAEGDPLLCVPVGGGDWNSLVFHFYYLA